MLKELAEACSGQAEKGPTGTEYMERGNTQWEAMKGSESRKGHKQVGL